MVSFTCYKPLSNNHMKLIAHAYSNLKRLHLGAWRYDHDKDKLVCDDVGLCAIADACIHLADVDLGGRLHFKEIGIGSLVRSCKNLRKLNLDGCVNVTDTSLKNIAEATRLEELRLGRCFFISYLGLQYLANGDLKYCLKTLWLDCYNRITNNGIIHLKNLVSLTLLNLGHRGSNITDNGDVALSELSNIEMLFLYSLINITSVGLRSFSGHQELLRLNLSSYYKFSWEDVKSIVLTFPALKDFNLSRRIKKPMPKEGFEDIYINGKHCSIYWQ